MLVFTYTSGTYDTVKTFAYENGGILQKLFIPYARARVTLIVKKSKKKPTPRGVGFYL